MSNSVALMQGERETGADVRSQNVTAAMAIANIVKTSLGPIGLDKMLVDDIGDITITNDGATILKQLEVEHPAAKVLVELADLQDQEVGDGTTSVVIIAAEMLKRANELVKNKIHPTTIMAGCVDLSPRARRARAHTRATAAPHALAPNERASLRWCSARRKQERWARLRDRSQSRARILVGGAHQTWRVVGSDRSTGGSRGQSALGCAEANLSRDHGARARGGATVSPPFAPPRTPTRPLGSGREIARWGVRGRLTLSDGFFGARMRRGAWCVIVRHCCRVVSRRWCGCVSRWWSPDRYRLALKSAVTYIKNNLMVKIEELGEDVVKQAAKTSMSSKILGPNCEFW